MKVRKDILRAKFSYFSGICCNQSFITARNEVSGKVIFLQVSVILLTGGGCVWGCVSGIHTPPRQTPPADPPARHPPGQTPPRADIPPRHTPPGLSTHPLRLSTPPQIRSTRGRYASYWNASYWNAYLLFESFIGVFKLRGRSLLFKANHSKTSWK